LNYKATIYFKTPKLILKFFDFSSNDFFFNLKLQPGLNGALFLISRKKREWKTDKAAQIIL